MLDSTSILYIIHWFRLYLIHSRSIWWLIRRPVLDWSDLYLIDSTSTWWIHPAFAWFSQYLMHYPAFNLFDLYLMIDSTCVGLILLVCHWFDLCLIDSTCIWYAFDLFNLQCMDSTYIWTIHPVSVFDSHFQLWVIDSTCSRLIWPIWLTWLVVWICIRAVQPAIHGLPLYLNDSSCFWIDLVCISWIRPLLDWFDKYFIHSPTYIEMNHPVFELI